MRRLYILYLVMIFLSPNLYFFLTGKTDKFIGFSEIMMPFLCFVNFLYFVLLKRYIFKNLEIKAKKILILLCILYGVGILGLLFTPHYDSQTLSFLIKYTFNILLFFQMIFLFTLWFKSVEKQSLYVNSIQKTLNVTLLVIIVVNIIELIYPSFIHGIFAYVFLEKGIHERFGFQRLSGTVGRPNGNAIILYFFTAYILSKFLLTKGNFLKNIFYMVLFLLLSILLILTGSRGGMLALFTQLIVFFYIKVKKLKPYWKAQLNLLVVFIFLISMVLLNMSDAIEQKLFKHVYEFGYTYSLYQKEMTLFLEKLGNYVPPALVERMFFLYMGINGYLRLPLIKKLIGIGLNGSEDVFINITGLQLSSVHNAFIEYLILTGIVGFIIFLILTWKIFMYVKESLNTFFGVMLYLFLIGVLVHSFFESNFMFNFKSMQIFLFFFSICIAERSIIQKKGVINGYRVLGL